ncbi:MAG: 16S rRNA (uracil(1498)-N(3))-methyltransferase [Legionella sp.]|nr:MAG: 16S rRNA (uracil(1498)-N(3))-methyltransferase [Legionella sp.]
MREIRIYQPGEYESGQIVDLSPEASQHVGVVLRMQPGEELCLFCGDNREFAARITQVKKKSVTVEILQVKEQNRESPLAIHLAQAISKGDRMEWVMQKAVELGVSSITPVISARCVVKLDQERMAKKLQQWQAIAIAACEQSGRNVVPKVHSALAFAEYIGSTTTPFKFILHPENSQNWRSIELKQEPVSLLIGPEGGFNEEEVALAKASGFQALSLGPRILRTETAAISALSLLQALMGDL